MTLTAGPSRPHLWANLLVFQAAWFAAVLSAAQQRPAWGTACIALALLWHLALSAQPLREAALLGLVTLTGLLIETATAPLGLISYPGHAPGALPPYWLVALWSLFALSLNVSLRWLRGRPALASLLGAVAGPLSFAAGVRMGAATFTDTQAALALLALQWALVMPLLCWLASRFDGVLPAPAAPVSSPEVAHG